MGLSAWTKTQLRFLRYLRNTFILLHWNLGCLDWRVTSASTSLDEPDGGNDGELFEVHGFDLFALE